MMDDDVEKDDVEMVRWVMMMMMMMMMMMYYVK